MRLDPGKLAGHVWLLAGASSCSKRCPFLAFRKNPSRLELASKYIKASLTKVASIKRYQPLQNSTLFFGDV